MAIPVLIIVREPKSHDALRSDRQRYEGMDRPRLGSVSDVPDALLMRGLALEDAASVEAKDAHQAFAADLLAAGINAYDVLALGAQPDESWEFLGYDIGESSQRAWSAIAHRAVFLAPDEQAPWESRLNAHGLFDRRADGEAFLALYLQREDPDRGWTEDGWTDEPEGYGVIPVYRYRQVTATAKA